MRKTGCGKRRHAHDALLHIPVPVRWEYIKLSIPGPNKTKFLLVPDHLWYLPLSFISSNHSTDSR
jgi:hypothetical protein